MTPNKSHNDAPTASDRSETVAGPPPSDEPGREAPPSVEDLNEHAPKGPARRRVLTEDLVQKLPCEPGALYTIYWDAKISGFGLRVSRGGTRSYLVSHRIGNAKNPKQITFARAHPVAFPLKKARDEAALRLHAMRSGVDPHEEKLKSEKHREGMCITLAQIFEKYAAANRPGDKGHRKPSTIKGYTGYMNRYLQDIKDKPLARLTKETCLAIFLRITKVPRLGKTAARKAANGAADGATDGVAEGNSTKAEEEEVKGAPIAANKTMVMLRALVNFMREEYKDEKLGTYPFLPVNPVTAMLRTHGFNKSKKKAITRRVSVKRIRAVYRWLKERGATCRNRESRTAADFARYLVLLAPRRTQGIELRFSHIDFETNVITMPASTSKNGQEFIRPVTPQLRALLLHRLEIHRRMYEDEGRVPPVDGWVFPSYGRSGHLTTARGTLDASEAIAGLHYGHHDLRRTLVDIAKALGCDPAFRRILLDHDGDVHDIHYENDPEAIRPGMERIHDWLESPEAPGSPESELIACAPKQDETAVHRPAWIALKPDELAQLVWEAPTVEVAQRFGVSDKAIEKRCKRWGIRKPGRGYWAKIASGKIDKMRGPEREITHATSITAVPENSPSVLHKEAPAASFYVSLARLLAVRSESSPSMSIDPSVP